MDFSRGAWRFWRRSDVGDYGVGGIVGRGKEIGIGEVTFSAVGIEINGIN